MIHDDLKHLARPVGDLKLLPGNPRKGDVEAVKRSYERFGQRKPIVALPDGTVIAGNHQLLAARALGWEEIAVVTSDDDEQTAKAFALADNRTSDLGSYDSDALAELLADVAVDPDLLLATGYTEADLDALIGEVEVVDFPELSSEDRDPFQRMTFTVHDNQAQMIEDAISMSRQLRLYRFTEWFRTQPVTANQINELTGTFMGGHYLSASSQPAIPTQQIWQQIRHLVSDVPDWVAEYIQREESEKAQGNGNARGNTLADICRHYMESQDDGKSLTS